MKPNIILEWLRGLACWRGKGARVSRSILSRGGRSFTPCSLSSIWVVKANPPLVCRNTCPGSWHGRARFRLTKESPLSIPVTSRQLYWHNFQFWPFQLYNLWLAHFKLKLRPNNKPIHGYLFLNCEVAFWLNKICWSDETLCHDFNISFMTVEVETRS